MTLSLGFSPCPNDTFIFDALVNKKIDTGGLDFELRLEDVETLNQWALEGKLDISKLSFPALFRSLEHYVLLDSGAALGKGVGPLLVTRAGRSDFEVEAQTIAIPGIHTTANLLLSFQYPGAVHKKPVLFAEIEDSVLNGDTDLGVLIHENRFTYQQRGLVKIADLGEYWEEQQALPIPLGGIAVSQGLKRSLALQVNSLIRQSLEYAFEHYPLITPFVRQHAQVMDEDIMRRHIDLYVNQYSLSLGPDGRKAIGTLYDVFRKNNPETATEEALFFLD